MMLIQKIEVTGTCMSLLEFLYEKREQEIPTPAPKGASVYMSIPDDYTGKIYGLDRKFFDSTADSIDDCAVLMDGSTGDRFVSFEVDNLDSVMLGSTVSPANISVIVRAWE